MTKVKVCDKINYVVTDGAKAPKAKVKSRKYAREKMNKIKTFAKELDKRKTT